jgi:hypothetical protein
MSADSLAAVWEVAAIPLALLVLVLGNLWLAWCRATDARLNAHEARLHRLEEERTEDGD